VPGITRVSHHGKSEELLEPEVLDPELLDPELLDPELEELEPGVFADTGGVGTAGPGPWFVMDLTWNQ
jgi:hypothetical protein